MLYSLKIKNIALISEAIIEFTKGLNILSGETGAGKSLVVGSMNLILGDRADRDLIKNGSDYALVEAVFYDDSENVRKFLIDQDIEPEENIIVTRKLSADGKSTCRINGSAVSLSVLRSFMENIVDIHGQHEHQALLYAKNHLRFIDSFAGEGVLSLKDSITGKRRELSSLLKELQMIGGSADDIYKQIDYMTFQQSEIEKAEIRIGEEDELKQERDILENAEKISEILRTGYEALYGEPSSAVDVVSRIISKLQQISDSSEKYAALLNQINEAYYSLEDAAHELKSESDRVYFDQQRYDEIQMRLDVIHEMKRKYGGSEESVLAFYDELTEKIEKLQNSDKLIAEYEGRIAMLKEELYGLHLSLLDKRQGVCRVLEKAIVAELDDLGMNGSRFEIRLDTVPAMEECDFTKPEMTGAEFYISTNVGEPLKPLAKVASGGEISRIMLAFKNVFAHTDEIGTLIFDEIDTGISGRIAEVVARKMSGISTEKQIICVTHLPQIVSYGDTNFLISKSTHLAKTSTDVVLLDREGKISEVARLVGGDTESAEIHAANLIKEADEYKKGLVI